MADIMLLQKWRLAAISFAVICLAPSLSAEAREPRVHHGNKKRCTKFITYSGPESLSLGARQYPCGTSGYSRVFTGTVRSAVDVGDDTRLEIITDEVFVGDRGELTATISQACLRKEEPEIQAGDRWLFYLNPKRSWDRKTHSTTIEGLEVPLYSPSKPIAEAKDDIAILRHLGGLTNQGILAGTVVRMGETDEVNPTAVSNHRVVAKNWPSGTEYTAVTNLNGRFEFELASGTYDVTATTERGLRDVEPWKPRDIEMDNGLHKHIGNADVGRRNCTEVDFSLKVDGRLAGRVTTEDGRPARFLKVAIIPVSPVHPQLTVNADENGHFEVGGRPPGQYIVGVGLLAPFASAEWKSRVYYPGVPVREQAKLIELGDGEWRTDSDFKLLPGSTAP
jgi:hypothetical protein